jgi:hypothetical protein
VHNRRRESHAPLEVAINIINMEKNPQNQGRRNP